jgi:hypothetical protein
MAEPHKESLGFLLGKTRTSIMSENETPNLSAAYRRTLEDLITSTGITLEEGERLMEQILEDYGPHTGEPVPE